MSPSPVPGRLADRHVVVTGGGTGIGRAIALRLAGEGARLSLLARDLGRLEATAAAALEAGAPSVEIASCDIRSQDSVQDAFRHFAAAQGSMYGLVANAGVGGPNKPGVDDRFLDLMHTNLAGTYWCCREAQHHLEAGPEPRHIVVVSSILARIGVADYTGYCASKAGLLGLVRALAMELAPLQVQVNAICPGWVETEMALTGLQAMADGMGTTLAEARALALSAVPLGRMSQPSEIAGVVSWLLSADARGATGQAFDVNHGAFMI